MISSENGKIKIPQLGASIYLGKVGYNCTEALRLALKDDNFVVVDQLLRSNSCINSKRAIPLMHDLVDDFNLSPSFNLRKAIRVLVDNGFDIEATDESLETALHKAVGHYEPNRLVVEVLVKNGADVNARAQLGDTPLHTAVSAYYNDSDSLERQYIVEYLIANGADMDIQDTDKCTIFHLAAMIGNEDMIHLLLKHGSIPHLNMMDKNEHTPLDHVEFGIQRGESIGYTSSEQGRPPYSNYATSYTRIKMTIILLQEADFHFIDTNLVAVNCHINKEDEGRDKHAEFERYYRFYAQEYQEYPKRGCPLCKFRTLCKRELEEMKDVTLTKHMSLFDIVRVNNPRYVLNQPLVSKLQSTNYEKQFPIYGGFINAILKEDQKKLKWFEEAKSSLTFILKASANSSIKWLISVDELKERILSNLSSVDLKNFILDTKKLTDGKAK